MTKNNNRLKSIVYILVAVCIIQTISIIFLKVDNEEFKNEMEQMNYNIQKLHEELSDLDYELYDYMENGNMEVAYEITKMDWENKNMEVYFKVQLLDANDGKKVMVNNTKEEIALTREGNMYTGIVNYPISEKMYKTTLWVQEDSYKSHFYYDEIGASTWASQVASCYFNGYAVAGNGQLTAVGDVVYSLYLDDKVVHSYCSAGNSILTIYDESNSEEVYEGVGRDGGSHGEKEITVSTELEDCEINENILFHRTMKVVALMESGVTIELYPALNTSSVYDADFDRLEYSTIGQRGEMHIIFSDGTKYEFQLGLSELDKIYEELMSN